jgi:uroporphyrin-III C-methyltransferase
MRSAVRLHVARAAHSARSGVAAPAPAAGIVYLIGAGPGAPDLITIRGLRCLQGADVVVHDRLVDPALIAAAGPGADIVYAGKRRGRAGLSQPAINDLLIAKARAGLTVARLKGGDPFVFGRGFEEIRALAEAGIRFEVVPGVSSATAVPGAAGIPLTHRGVSSGFAVVTAERARGATDWGALAHVDTLVILMGIERLGEATRELIRHGRDGATPVAVIERGTMGGEKIVVSVLREAARDAATAALRPPAIVIVGEVVRLRGPASFQAAGSIADGRAEPVFHDTTWR